jgi:two-component system response regulator FixJ
MLPEPVVYIVDDDAIAREAVAALVDEMQITTRSFASAEEFLAAYNGHRPACLVTDLRMRGMSGLELQERLAAGGITLSVIVITAYPKTSSAVRAVKAGAINYLEKPCRDEELWDAIRAGLAADAERFQREQRIAEIRRRIASLTPAERKVMDRIVEGLSNKAMAHRLRVSVRTIEVRRHHVFQKMNADSVAELVKMVLEAGGG